jgi:hypothetical protein
MFSGKGIGFRLAAARSMPERVHPGELRSEQKDLGGVINPHQHDDERARGTEAGDDATLSDVQTDQKFSKGESNAVTPAPIHTSCHPIFARGKNL